jgi:hypothetical protein
MYISKQIDVHWSLKTQTSDSTCIHNSFCLTIRFFFLSLYFFVSSLPLLSIFVFCLTWGMTLPKASKTIAAEVEEKVESTVEATNTESWLVRGPKGSPTTNFYNCYLGMQSLGHLWLQ